jgi:hypothetical protein
MSLLLGVESGPAETATTANKKQTASQFEANASGTVTDIHVMGSATEWSSVTSVSIGILGDKGPNEPGTRLGFGSFPEKPPTNAAFAITGLSVAITAGVKYWLALVTQGAGSARILQTATGSSTLRKSTKSTYNEITENSEWEAAVAHGPLFIWATGTLTESGQAFAMML